jgi:tRNA(Ile)-lysidine synthase
MMQEINPSVKESILNTAEHLDGASAIYKQGIDEGIKRVRTAEGICIERLMQEPAPATLLFEILYPLGFNTAQIGDIYRSLEGQPGKIFTSEHWCIVKDREYLLIEAHRHPIQPALAMEEHVFTPDFVIPRDKNTACFDADKLTHPLLLRPWRQGDSFIPFGMKGRKKVSDYMTDRKFSLLRKEQQWVLCCGEEIIWLIGERTDNRFRIGASTKRILTVRLLTAGDSPVTP